MSLPSGLWPLWFMEHPCSPMGLSIRVQPANAALLVWGHHSALCAQHSWGSGPSSSHKGERLPHYSSPAPVLSNKVLSAQGDRSLKAVLSPGLPRNRCPWSPGSLRLGQLAWGSVSRKNTRGRGESPTEAWGPSSVRSQGAAKDPGFRLSPDKLPTCLCPPGVTLPQMLEWGATTPGWCRL